MATKKTLTATQKLNLILQPGKVVGEQQIRELIIKALASMDVPAKIKPKITFDSSLTDIGSEIRRMEAEIEKRLAGELHPSHTLSKLTDPQVKDIQKATRDLDKLATSGLGISQTKQFQDKRFQTAYEKYYEGQIKDPKTGKMVAVNTLAKESLASLRDETGKPLFPKDFDDNLRRYQAEAGKLAKQIDRTGDSVRNLRSLNIAHPTSTAGVGATQGARPRPSFLAAEAATLQQTAAEVGKGVLSPRELTRRQEATSKAAIAENNRIDRETRMRMRAYDEALKVEAQRQSNIANLTRGQRGAQALYGKLGKGVIGSVKDYENAVLHLKQQIAATDKAATRLLQPDKVGDKGAQRQLKGLEAAASRYKIALQQVQTEQRKVTKGQLQAGTLRAPVGGVSQVKKIVGELGLDAERNARRVGREAFEQSGGFGGSRSVPRADLEDLATYHRSRVQSLRTERSELNLNSKANRAHYHALGRDLHRHGLELERVSERMRNFGSTTQQAGALFRQFFRYAIGYGALYQALAAVRALTSGVIDLGKELKSIQAITQATNAEMRLIEVGIKGIATETQFNTKEIAEAAQILGQAGVIPQDLPSALRATALFASATGSAIQLSADLVTSMRNVFDTLSDGTIANQLTQAINISKLTAGDLKTVISLSSQISKSYGLASEQYLAAVTTLRNAGLKPSTVATGLRQGLIELFSPDTKTVNALKLRYQQLGEQLTSSEVADKFFGFSVTDTPLVSALSELRRLGFTGEGKKVFQRAYDVRAENALSALINNLDELEGATTKLDFGQAAILAAQTQMESLSNSVTNLGAAISVLAHDVGGPALSFFEGMADGATKVVKSLTDLNLQLKALKGAGLEIPILAGLLSGGLGAFKYRGGIVEKGVAALGFGYAGGSLANKFSGVGDDGVIQEEAETTFQRISRYMVEAAKTAFGLIGTVLSIELVNVLLRRGSPLLSDIGRKARGKFSRKKNTDEDLSIISGNTGSIVGGAAQAVETVSVVSLLFGGKFKQLWAKIATKAVAGRVALASLNAKHPVALAIGGTIALAALVASFFTAGSDKKDKVKLAALIKRRDRSEAAYKKSLEDQAEFRLSTPELPAEEGTTAASIERLEDDLSSFEANMREYFGGNATRVQGLTDALLELNRTSPESGTASRDAGLQRIQDMLDTAEVSTSISDQTISVLSGQASSIVNRGQAIRETVAKYIQNLRERGDDLDEVQKSFLQAYNSLAQEDPVLDAVIHDLRTGLTPLQTADVVVDYVKDILNRQQEIYQASEHATTLARDRIEDRTAAIRGVIADLVADPSQENFLSVVRSFGVAFVGLSDAAVNTLEQYIEILDAEQERLKKRLATPEEIEAQRAALKSKPVQPGRGGANIRSKRGETDAQLQAQIDAFRDTAEADEAALKQAERFEARLEKTRSEKIAQKGLNANLRAEDLKNDIEALQEKFGEGAKTPERYSFERQYPQGSEQRSRMDELLNLLKNPKKVSEVLSIGDKGESNIPQPLIDALNNFRTVEQEIIKRNDAASRQFFESLPLNRQRNALESEISLAKKSKDYAPLTTDDESQNLYKKLQAVRILQIREELAHLNNSQPIAESEIRKRDKRKFELEKELDDVKAETIENIKKANIDSTQAELQGYKLGISRYLAGLKKQLARALDSGNLQEAQDLDAKIINLKKQILELEIKHYRALGKSEAFIADFKAGSEEDMIPVLSQPPAARRVISGIQRRLKRDSEPRTSDSDVEEGYNKQQNVVTSISQRTEQRLENISRAQAELSQLRFGLERALDQADSTEESTESIAAFREEIQRLNEEIGKLRGENVDESLVENLPAQLVKGFDFENISNKIGLLDTSIGNLGNTLQDTIVSGLDNMAGGFAQALVAGENFGKGVRKALADLALQLAAAIVQAVILRAIMASLGLASGGVVTSGGTTVKKSASGGKVEAYAGGGIISGPGTGTSDSVPGVITDANGVPTRGIAVSDGEGIVTAKAVKGMGEDGLHKINKADNKTLRMFRGVLAGFRQGGVPSSMNVARIRSGASMSMATPMRFATGGVVRELASMDKTLKTGGNSTVNHQFQTNLNVEGEGASGLDPDTLRRLDDGISIKIQSYVEEQLRPGGLLQSARAGAKR